MVLHTSCDTICTVCGVRDQLGLERLFCLYTVINTEISYTVKLLEEMRWTIMRACHLFLGCGKYHDSQAKEEQQVSQTCTEFSFKHLGPTPCCIWFSMDNICKLELSNFHFGNLVLDMYTWINMWRANHLTPDVFNTLRKCCSQAMAYFTTRGGDSYKSSNCCSFNVYFLKIICSLVLTYVWQKNKKKLPTHNCASEEKSQFSVSLIFIVLLWYLDPY